MIKEMMTDTDILRSGFDLVYYGGCALLATQSYLLLQSSSDFDKLFKGKNICIKIKKREYYPKIKNKQKTSYGYLLRVQMPIGLTSEDLIKNQLAIDEMLNARTGIYYCNKYTYIKVYQSDLESKYDFEKVKLKGLRLLFGHSINGIEYVNLTDGEPHLLIAGETGSGKSTLIRGILTNLTINNDTNNIELHLIDLKGGVELGIFKDCVMTKSFAKDTDEAKETLQIILNEVTRRYDLFAEKECVSIAEYNKSSDRKLKRWLVVIDEFAELSSDKENIELICRLSALARACGIHLVLSTQRPDKDVLNGRIKANVTVVAGLKTKDSVNSRIILDETGLERLRGKGHGLLKVGGDTIEFQAMNITTGEAKELIKPFKVTRRTQLKLVEQKDPFEVFK